MADDGILNFLGLGTDQKEHPADPDALSFLGLKPHKEEHPVYSDPYNLGDPEERWKTPKAPSRSRLGDFARAIDTSSVIPAMASDIGSNIMDSASSSAGVAMRGAQDLLDNKLASGVVQSLLGTAGVFASPLTGTVRSGANALDQMLGKPNPVLPSDLMGNLTGDKPVDMASFGDRASMVFPFRVGGPVVSTATNALKPSTRALDLIAEHLTTEQLNRMKTNPRLRAMDVSKGVRDLAVGTAKDASQPRAMAPVVASMEHSAATAKDAVRGTYNAAMGEPPNLFEEYTKLQDRAKEIGKTKIQPALDASLPIDTSGVITDMDKVIKPGAQAVVPGEPKFQSKLQTELQEWKSELTDGSSILTDPQKLHDVQSEMRRRAEELSMNPETRRLGRQLYDYRNKLVDAIDASAPGYKEGLSKYRDQKDIERAFEFGRDTLKNTGDIKTDPSYLKQWVNHPDRTPEELDAARLGARQAVEQKMGSIKSSGLDAGRSGTDVPQVDFNRQKLEHLFGKEQTDQMFQHLQDERDIAVTNSRGLSNSTTAEAQAAQAKLKPREISQPHSNLPGWALALGAGTGALTNPTIGAITGAGLLGVRGAKTAYDYAGHQLDLSRNASLAQLISRNDPETISKLTAAISRAGSRNKLSNLLAPP